MATTPTTGDIPSNAAVDLKFNSEQFDRVMNSDDLTYTDRFGKKRITMKGVQELANGFQDTFTNLLGSPDGFKLIGQVDSVEKLTGLTGVNGNRILVKGYYQGSNLGGGEFYYDSTLAMVNNGVTVFNGWVRKITNNLIKDLDAGCLPNDDSNSYLKLTNLFSVLTDGMTVEFHCLNKSSVNFVIKNLSGITLISRNGGGISCWDYRESFSFVFDSNFEAGNSGLFGSLGILSFYNCPDTKVEGLKITGIQKIIPQSNEWGDCAIRYENCPRFTITKNTFKHFGGWGIFGGFGSDNSNCSFNFIQHVHRQSGINIFANSSYCKANDNIIIDCGLYGGEFETFGAYSNYQTTGNEFVRNTIVSAKIGVCSVGGMLDGLVANNTISKCMGGLASILTKDPMSTTIEFKDNTVRSFWYGISVNNSANVSYNRNTLEYTQPDFLITDQYQAPVLKDGSDPKVFYSTLPIAAGKVIKIADSIYTVSSYSSVTAQSLFGSETYYKLNTFYKITLTTDIQSDFYTFANIYFSWATLNTTAGTYGIVTNNTVFSQPNVVDGARNIKFAGNIISGVKFGLNPNNTYSSLTGPQEKYINNKFDCDSWIRTGIVLGQQVSLSGNTSSQNTSMTIVTAGSDTTNWVPNDKRAFLVSSGITAGAAFPKNYFRVDKTSFVVGYRVILRSWSSTETISLILANVNSPITITPSGSGTETVVEIKTHLYAISPGISYPAYLQTASNSAATSWFSIEVLLLN